MRGSPLTGIILSTLEELIPRGGPKTVAPSPLEGTHGDGQSHLQVLG